MLRTTPIRSFLLMASSLTLVWACASDEAELPAPAETGDAVAAEPQPSSPSQPVPVPEARSDDTLGVLGLLDDLRATPTAAVWAAGRPDRLASLELNDVDPFYELPPIFGTNPFWCLRSILVDSLSNGLTRRRYHFFYRDEPPPAPPADLALPPLSPGLDHQLQSCSLRMVASEIRDGDDAAVLGDLRALHMADLGEPTAVERSAMPYGLQAGDITTWVAGDVTVGVGMGVTGAPIAMAFLPMPEQAGVAYLAPDRLRGTRAWLSEIFDSALDAAELRQETRAIVDGIRAGQTGDDPEPLRDRVLTVLRDLVERPARIAAGDPETDRYAARLTVADLLLRSHYSFIPRPEGATDPSAAMAAAEVAFNELGANYAYTELEYATMYFGSFADSVSALPPGPGGWSDLGRLGDLEEGCNWDPVLATTAELLTRVTQPRIRARLHYLRAEALSSIVAFHQVKQLRPGVVDDIEEVRREALDHYREALAGGLNPEDAAVAWQVGWSVATNGPPPPRYDCRRA